MKEREGLRERVNRYIQQKLDNEFEDRINKLFDGVLVQEFREYMERRLDKYIQDMIRNSLDAALDELYSEFELGDYDGNDRRNDEPETKIDRSDAVAKHSPPQDVLSPDSPVMENENSGRETKLLYGLLEDELAFLAYCQYYNEHTGQNPQSPKLSKVFSGQPGDYRERLIKKGWMTKDNNPSNGRVIDYPLSRKIPNPQEVLKSYFDSEDVWRQQEDPDYE